LIIFAWYLKFVLVKSVMCEQGETY